MIKMKKTCIHLRFKKICLHIFLYSVQNDRCQYGILPLFKFKFNSNPSHYIVHSQAVLVLSAGVEGDVRPVPQRGSQLAAQRGRVGRQRLVRGPAREVERAARVEAGQRAHRLALAALVPRRLHEVLRVERARYYQLEIKQTRISLICSHGRTKTQYFKYFFKKNERHLG